MTAQVSIFTKTIHLHSIRMHHKWHIGRALSVNQVFAGSLMNVLFLLWIELRTTLLNSKVVGVGLSRTAVGKSSWRTLMPHVGTPWLK